MSEYQEFLEKYPGINLLEESEAAEYYWKWKEENDTI